MRHVDALVDEAGKASAVLWVRLPGSTRPAWYSWVDGAAVVVHEGDEQSLPGLRDAPSVELVLRSKDKGSLLVVVPVRAVALEPGTPPYDAAVSALHAARQSAPDGEGQPARWAATSLVTRLEPVGPPVEGPGSYDSGDRREPPVDTEATTLSRLPLVLGRRARRRPKL
jgi:hypothetical protein